MWHGVTKEKYSLTRKNMFFSGLQSTAVDCNRTQSPLQWTELITPSQRLDLTTSRQSLQLGYSAARTVEYWVSEPMFEAAEVCLPGGPVYVLGKSPRRRMTGPTYKNEVARQAIAEA